MNIYLKDNVYEAAIKRIERLFDEFDNVVVGFSGGKDSTVVLNLAIEVARKRGRLPVKVMFLDQEAEWTHTVDYMRLVDAMPETELEWLQVPIRMSNNASQDQSFLHAWGEGQEWVREKEPNSVKENIFGVDRFHAFFGAWINTRYKDQKACYLAGVRTQESHTRKMGIVNSLTYKDISWGKKFNDLHYTFYPIYDWEMTDVWKYIHDNDIPYNKLYDYMYQYGVQVNSMRVSSLVHETALQSMAYLQEIDRDMWNRITRRVQGANTVSKLSYKSFKKVDKLPFMFSSWAEYTDYLTENLITNEEHRKKYRAMWASTRERYREHPDQENMERHFIQVLLSNDLDFVKLQAWATRPEQRMWLKWYTGKIRLDQMNVYVTSIKKSLERGIQPIREYDGSFERD